MISQMSHVEIHFHLLPGVDDGPANLEESVELAAAAVADGTRTIVTTPHVHPLHITDPEEIRDRVHELTARLQRERVGLQVRPGGELADGMVAGLSERQLEAIAQGPPGRRWLLLEAPFRGMDDDYLAAAAELRERGFAVVIAHPERAMIGRCARAALEHELAAGSPIQLTAWSFAGLYGERVRTIALRLLRTAPHVVISSDAHGGARMPSLRLALDALAASGEPGRERHMAGIPRALLEHGLAGEFGSGMPGQVRRQSRIPSRKSAA
jgi:protein-tyrosine phosphatase